MGRPTKLDELVTKKFVNAVILGLPLKQAARLAGISYNTYLSYLSKADAEKQPFLDFVNQLKAAEVQAEASALNEIRKAAQGEDYTIVREKYERVVNKDDGTEKVVLVDRSVETGRKKWWQASAWILERRFPERWARVDKQAFTDVTGQEDLGLDRDEKSRARDVINIIRGANGKADDKTLAKLTATTDSKD